MYFGSMGYISKIIHICCITFMTLYHSGISYYKIRELMIERKVKKYVYISDLLFRACHAIQFEILSIFEPHWFGGELVFFKFSP